MSARRTNVGLLLALAAAFATGVLAYGVGSGWNVYVSVGHAIAGFVVIVLSPWKSVIARRGLRRQRRGRRASVALSVLTLAALLFGLLHSTGLARSFGVLTAMQLHVGAALLSLPFVVWHIAVRPARLHRTDIRRRQVLHGAAVTAAGAVVFGLSKALEHVAGLPGRSRRFTGSYEEGSGTPEEMPVTQWLDDDVPIIDVAQWTLLVAGRSWSHEQLTGFDQAVDALIDCTGGWFATQRWEGAWLHDLVGDTAGARTIVVRSATGYQRSFPIEDASRLLVAHRVAGEPLSPGHGYPARLVAPGRRGFWWVKWITEIELSDRPWWIQSPFPLT
ncbi:MAG TPA: molybdopterin-dependent oxidoreductase [Actinomycetota bacterium]|nr:molybdopterin-dependent oxidoreductase [Actinomycetota bacterium]